MSRKAVDVVLKQLGAIGHPFTPCVTETITLSGGNFSNRAEIFNYIEKCTGEASQIGATPAEVEALVWKYGSNTGQIIEKAYALREDEREAGSQTTDYINQAEVWYAINHELTLNLGDFLIRRTGMLFFERPKIAEKLTFYTQQFARFLNWDEVEVKHQLDFFKNEYNEVLNFKGTE